MEYEKTPGPTEPLTTLLRKIEKGPLLPAFRNNVQDLLSLQADSYNSVQDVSRIILRDLSLTTQILRLVNTVYFQTYRHQVHTITNAVMLIGLERVRDLAVSLQLFEHFRQSPNFSTLQRLIVLSFFTAILSQTLVQGSSRNQEEELFITALLFNLGEMIAAHHFPEEYEKIRQVATRQGISSASAMLQILQVSPEELGLAILKHWHFPAGLIKRLTYYHCSNGSDTGPEAYSRKLIKTAHNLGQGLLNPAFSSQEWQQRINRCCRVLGLESGRLNHVVAASLKNLLELTQILRIDLQELDLTMRAIPSELQEEWASPPLVSGKEPPIPLESQGSERVRQLTTPERRDLENLRFFHKVIGEINQALVSGVALNEIMAMIIEGIYRAIGFERVIFCLLNPQRTVIAARFGLGSGVEELLPGLRLPFSPSGNIFARALAERREYLVDVDTRPTDRELMDARFWRVSQTTTFLVSPVYVDQVPIGVFYADRSRSRNPITEEDRQSLQVFRDLAVIAIHFSSSQS